MQLVWKRFWCGAVLVSVLGGILLCLPVTRIEYHKSRLQGLKAKQERYKTRKLSITDKFRLYVIGNPESNAELENAMRKQEDALVRLGFLQREEFVAGEGAGTAQVGSTSKAIASECPWQHVETWCGTNVVVTACAYGMGQWRKRAQEFGWKSARKS